MILQSTHVHLLLAVYSKILLPFTEVVCNLYVVLYLFILIFISIVIHGFYTGREYLNNLLTCSVNQTHRRLDSFIRRTGHTHPSIQRSIQVCVTLFFSLSRFINE